MRGGEGCEGHMGWPHSPCAELIPPPPPPCALKGKGLCAVVSRLPSSEYDEKQSPPKIFSHLPERKTPA